MGNMSYCRFENTLRDLQDCEEQLNLLIAGEGAKKIPADSRESQARIDLVDLCLEIAERFDEQRRLLGMAGATTAEIIERLEEDEDYEGEDDEA